MLGVEDVMSELAGEEGKERGLPPGFRFHPTDEELVTFYLASKLFNGGGLFGFIHIPEVDLNHCEPWELPEVARMGEKEWYFYSLRDRKYPTGLRTNRATAAGYWKVTGKDKEIFAGGGGAPAPELMGMKKTLVFYKGRAPRGIKTKWVMHEYRLESLRHACKLLHESDWEAIDLIETLRYMVVNTLPFSVYERNCSVVFITEEWVICRVFNKTGDRRNVRSHAQINNLDSSSSSNHHDGHHRRHHLTLPPLLEAPQPPAQLPSLLDHHGHEADELKTLINPEASQLDTIIFSSEQDDICSVSKQLMKTESSDNRSILRHQNPDFEDYYFKNAVLFQESDFNLLGLSPSSSAPADLHVIFDSPAAESWPLDL